MFQPQNEVSNKGGNFCGSDSRSDALAKGKDWRTIGHETADKEGRSYAYKIESPYETGSYDLRYTRNGKRMWESVGNDITLALQEQRARQSALETPEAARTVDAPVHRMLREVAGEFLATKPRENWRRIVNAFGEWWGWGKEPADFQRPDFRAFGEYVASLGLRPRSEQAVDEMRN